MVMCHPASSRNACGLKNRGEETFTDARPAAAAIGRGAGSAGKVRAVNLLFRDAVDTH